VDKGQGSVEDGIEFIKSFDEVILHTRCVKTKEEFDNYSYKIDRMTGDILPDIVDTWNHYCDGIRYALEPAMQAHQAGAEGFSAGQQMASAADY
jgi:phage terminase large subunit